MRITKIKLLIFTLLLSFTAITGGILIKSGNNNKYQQQLNLGYQFLNKMDYQAAIAAFNGAIEIDPKAYEAFLGITQAYMGIEEYASAVSYMEQIYALTQNVVIKQSLETIQNLTNTDEIKKELENAIEHIKPGSIISSNETVKSASDSLDNNVTIENKNTLPQVEENIERNPNSIYPTQSQEFLTKSFNYTASEFTFMGYPVNENHFYEWKAAIGIPEDSLNTLLPGNSMSAYMSYEDSSEYDTPSADVTITGWQALHLLDESETPIIDWAYRAGQGIPYYFLFGTASGAEGWQASIATNVGTPIPLGSSFEEVITILGCTQAPVLNADMVTVYGNSQNPMAYINYISSGDMWPSYGDTCLSITSTVSSDQFNIYFRNNLVSAIDVWSRG